MYMKHRDGKFLIVLSAVDDLVYTGSPELIQEFEDTLRPFLLIPRDHNNQPSKYSATNLEIIQSVRRTIFPAREVAPRLVTKKCTEKRSSGCLSSL